MISLVPGVGVGFLSRLFSGAFPQISSLDSGVADHHVLGSAALDLAADQVLVTTAHDRIDRVLEKHGVSHRVIDRLRISEALLAGARFLFVGCGQPLSARSPERIAEWVKAGGCLLTSDWMAYHVLQPAFRDGEGEPLVRYAEPFSAQEASLVSVTEADLNHPATKVMLGDEPFVFWKVAQSTYPVRVNEERVRVLARARALAHDFDGADTLLLRFDYGRGQVVHMISHWYDQHFEQSPPSSERPPSSRSTVFGRR